MNTKVQLVVAASAALVFACSAPQPPAPTQAMLGILKTSESERISIKQFIRDDYLEKKPWYTLRTEDIQVLLPPRLPNRYVFTAVVGLVDKTRNWTGRIYQVGIARPDKQDLLIQWEAVLEQACIEPVPKGSRCDENRTGS